MFASVVVVGCADLRNDDTARGLQEAVAVPTPKPQIRKQAWLGVPCCTRTYVSLPITYPVPSSATTCNF